MILESLILGAVQGFTEWLPISSTAHIFLAETFFGLTPSIQFAAWLHGGSLLAVIVFYRRRIWEILKDSFSFLRARDFEKRNVNAESVSFALQILLATLISVPIILFFERSGLLYAMTIQAVAVTLIITGILILAAEYLPKKTRKLSLGVAALFGIAQGLAVFPGISRAGITIALLLALGVERKKAVDFSFLAAIPMLCGALVFAMSDFRSLGAGLPGTSLWIAFVASFATSLVGMYYMRKWVEVIWVWFAVYCFLLAGFLILL